MNKTRKGLLWKLRHSWWILLTFTFILNWVAFIYIGMKVKNKSWTKYGLIYAIPFFLSLISDSFIENKSVNTLWGGAFLVSGVISISHAFKIRKEFLTRLEASELAKKYADTMLIDQIESEYGLGSEIHSDRAVPATVSDRGPLTRQS
ncbi:hypothetical protein [Paenibacillus antarcticus]|uniref:Uncharacterized protein n=1 Tax=Paenibacillus antarcticus TaxID=253703 RepID=A0A168QLT8_9BACL|nr:hypothetical protein [Paenibacillus antarcticus]OAB47937.1 hypothetical protein PBAT_03425 [Paenibacillus antarcticus]